MSRVDELLGRLETSAVRYEMGRGGIPELTPQDIAAALAMCEDHFAAPIYQAVYGGTVNWQEVDREVARAQFAEWRERMDRMVNAQLAHASAQFAPRAERQAKTCHAEQLIAGARAAMWPQLIESTYAKVRMHTLSELRDQRICPSCKGRGSVMRDNVIAQCYECTGTGRTRVSDRQRAAALGMNESTYRRIWRPMYEWLYRLLSDSLVTGRKQFADALERTLG